MQEATEGVLKKLGDSLRENPENSVSHHSKIFEKMLSKPLYTTILVNKKSNCICGIVTINYYTANCIDAIYMFV